MYSLSDVPFNIRLYALAATHREWAWTGKIAVSARYVQRVSEGKNVLNCEGKNDENFNGFLSELGK